MPVSRPVVAPLTVNENRQVLQSNSRAGPAKPQGIDSYARTTSGRASRTTRAQLAQAEHDGEDSGSWLPWPGVAYGLTEEASVLSGFGRCGRNYR
jgi:hypothetical protein